MRNFHPISSKSSSWIEMRFREEDLRDLCGYLGRIEKGLPFTEDDYTSQQARHFARVFRREMKRLIS